MLFNGLIHTGTRIFNQETVLAIDLWKTDESAEIVLSDDNGYKKILLDQDESRVIRDWASASMQSAIIATQADLVATRCGLQEQLTLAAKLNRAAVRAKKKKPARKTKTPRPTNPARTAEVR